MSGVLDWTPMHTSDVFWRQNIDKFEEKDFQVLGCVCVFECVFECECLHVCLSVGVCVCVGVCLGGAPAK